MSNSNAQHTQLLKCTGSYHDYLMSTLKDEEEATAYLQIALDEYQKDNNTEAFMLALRNVAQATGGIGSLAKKAELNRQHLYHTLSSKGNPSLKKLNPILNGLGFHLFIGRANHLQHTA